MSQTGTIPGDPEQLSFYIDLLKEKASTFSRGSDKLK